MKNNDMNDMKKLFLDESSENLAKLEKQIQALDHDINDNLPLVELYRLIHNMKGMAGTMGIVEMEKFCHTYESLISAIQEKKVELNRNVLDIFFDSVDVFENIFNMIRDGKGIGSYCEDFQGKLEQLQSKGSVMNADEQRKARMTELFKEFGLQEFQPESLVFNDQTKKFYSITIKIESNIRLKRARLFVIIKNIGNLGVIVQTTPPFVELVEGTFEDTFSLLFQSSNSAEKIRTSLELSGEIESIQIDEVEFEKAKQMIERVETEKEDEKNTQIIENSTQINSVKVEISVLDHLMESFGELLIRNKQLERTLGVTENAEVREILFQMQTFMFQLQDLVLQMQLIPVATALRAYPRMVRSLAQKEHKKIKLTLQHNDIKVDRKILNELGEILNHFVRNAISHGIEPEEERVKLKKHREAELIIAARLNNNVLLLDISDDGRGIDPEKIKQSALEKSIRTADQLAAMSNAQIIDLIYEPNFSTLQSADLVSGRGLGMNIVKRKVESLGGTIKIDTEVGKGTTFTVLLPISRSLIRALLTRAGNEIYSIALDDIQSLFEVNKDDIFQEGSTEYVKAVGNIRLPLYRLSNIFQLHDNGTELKGSTLKIVHIKKGDKNFALAVDDFLHESELVIKKIDDIPHDVKGISGAAILDDGKVSLIIDPFTIVG
jgi:two-component system chemotaxis sensor kinase CheA